MGEKQCEQCHPTCKQGCDDDQPCPADFECHPDCATCDGPGKDECTSCYCNASLEGGSGPSCCTCDDDYVGHANYCKLAICEDAGCHVCVQNNDEHSCVTCKDNFQYVQADDEEFGRCEYCPDDDFYPFPSCGARSASGLIHTFSDDTFTPACECGYDQHLVDGHCTTCGKNCHDCDAVKCLECDFGFWFDHTMTVCIDFCPTGSVYDSNAMSGMCVSDSGVADIVDVSFNCVDPVQDTLDPVIQRYFEGENTGGYQLSGNDACYAWTLYGGANAGSVENDDPVPIPNRGYWFDGECKFLTLEGFVPSLSVNYGGWFKPHSTDVSLYGYTPKVDGGDSTDQYNELYLEYDAEYDEEYACWESTNSQTYQCVEVYDFAIYEWGMYVFVTEVLEGYADYEAYVDGDL